MNKSGLRLEEHLFLSETRLLLTKKWYDDAFQAYQGTFRHHRQMHQPTYLPLFVRNSLPYAWKRPISL